MNTLKEVLGDYLAEYFRDRLRQSPTSRLQPVVVGPPRRALGDLYGLLTGDGAADWELDWAGGSTLIPVLLIDDRASAEKTESAVSAVCSWDYAVNLRDSQRVCLCLCTPERWSDRLVSMANATETIGTPRIQDRTKFCSEPLWSHLVDVAGGAPARMVLTLTARSVWDLGGGERDLLVWSVLERLLAADSIEDFVLAAGLPSLGKRPLDAPTLRSSYQVLNNLSRELGKRGLSEGRKALQVGVEELVRTGALPEDAGELVDGMVDHIRDRARTAAEFSECPQKYYAPNGGDSRWWAFLSYERLSDILGYIGWQPPSETLRLTVTNALNDGEPWIVASDAELRASAAEGQLDDGLLEFRWRTKGHYQPVTESVSNGLVIHRVPVHEVPVTYYVEGPNLKGARATVVALESFAAGGFAVVADAKSTSAPRPREEGDFVQEVALSEPGTWLVRLYARATVSWVEVQDLRRGATRHDRPRREDGTPFEIEVSLEGDCQIELVLRGDGGELIETIILDVVIDEPDKLLPLSRFEALVAAHQRRLSADAVRVGKDSRAIRGELERVYLDQESSWRGVLAGWSRPAVAQWTPNWDTGCIGDLEFGVDPRPKGFTAPVKIVRLRNDIREVFKEEGGIAEADLTRDGFAALVEEYVSAYSIWIEEDPETATWFDLIAIYSRDLRSYASTPPPSSEPVALLLSPLHPLRLGWSTYAQMILSQGLESHPCPAAALLDPFASPGVYCLPSHEAGATQWHGYIRGGVNEVHWALLWHSEHLGDQQSRKDIEEALARLGLMTASTVGGVGKSHAMRALNEVQRILPARASMRVGVVGEGDQSTAVIAGLSQWCRQSFAQDSAGSGFPVSCTVYDERDSYPNPSAAALQLLQSDTGERVQWIRGAGSEGTRLDLLLLNDVLTRAWKLSASHGDAPIRSVVGRGGLVRIDLREDFEGAHIIQQGCEALQEATFPGIGGQVLRCQLAVEALCGELPSQEVLEFRPDQEAIQSGLRRANFLAATSGEVDPACFARGIRGAGGYLWDYELPDIASVDDERVGYYLVGSLSEPLRESVKRAAHLITDQEVEPDQLLLEIARCGIPILRRFALGGGAARGELGLLLAVRLLQDVFGPESGSVQLPVWRQDGANLILPVDSYWPTLSPFCDAIDAPVGNEHPDLLMFSVRLQDDEDVRIRITPIEVKFRQNELSVPELRAALNQAGNLGTLLSALWCDEAPNELWRVCTSALLARYVDQAFRVYADPSVHGTTRSNWSRLHETVIHRVLGECVTVSVATEGRVLAFDASDVTRIEEVDERGHPHILVVSRGDAELLLTRRGSIPESLVTTVGNMGFEGGLVGSEAPKPEPELGEGLSEEDGTIEAVEPTAGAGPFSKAQPEGPGATAEGLADIRARVRAAFDGFVGNQSAVRRLQYDLIRALMEAQPHLPKNLLFTGLPSTGKTELARRVARALGLPFVSLDGAGLTSRARLFELVRKTLEHEHQSPSDAGVESGLPVREYPPLAIFVDEVHLVSRAVQESLLKVLESSDRRLLLETEVADFRRATFLFATTRASELDPAFRSRCTELALQDYNLEEVAEIVRRRYPHSDWSDEVYLRIAKLGRTVPRVALDVARDLETTIKVSEEYGRSAQEHLDEVKDLREIDERGLTRLDRDYLATLESEARPVGEKAILSLLGAVDKERILTEVEPFLRRLDFIRLGPTGRELTSAGERYLRAIREGRT